VPTSAPLFLSLLSARENSSTVAGSQRRATTPLRPSQWTRSCQPQMGAPTPWRRCAATTPYCPSTLTPLHPPFSSSPLSFDFDRCKCRGG
jgi:hypothetical protein